MKKNFTLFPLGVLLLFSLSISAQSNLAIKLNGTSNYISGTSEVIPADISNFTVEFWVYVPSLSTTAGLHYFIYQGPPQGSGGGPFYIGYDGATGNIQIGDDANSFFTTAYNTGIKMPAGEWVHLALVADQLGNMSDFYMNGKLKQSFLSHYTTSTTFLQIGGQDPGDGSGATDFGNGTIDELRVWGDPTGADATLGTRTAAQINAGLLGVDPSSPGLIAYYNMNDDITGSTVKNVSTSTSTGTPGDNDLFWSIAGTSWVASPIQASLNAINLNGGFDAIHIPNNPAYDLINGGTIEMWIYPTAFNTGNSTLIANRETNGNQNVRYSFHVASSNISLWTGIGGGFSYINYATPLNAWTHLAFVYDNVAAVTKVYINGTLFTGSGSSGSSNATLSGFGPTTGQPLSIGGDSTTTESFIGDIDEVSIWNTQMDASAIATTMTTPPTGNESGIISLFSFNEGIPGGTNTGLTTILDNNTVTSNHGKTSASMALSASASNFILSTITPLPVNFTSFTATAQDYQALLQWQTAQEQNSRDYTIERSPDGIHYSGIGSVPAAGNSSLPSNYSFVDPSPLNGTNYYRLKETDLDGKFMYSIIRSLNFSLSDAQKLVWFQTGEKAVEVDLRPGSNELYSVTDISGRLLQQGQLSSGKLYLSQLPAGLYVIQVITNTGAKLNTKVLVK